MNFRVRISFYGIHLSCASVRIEIKCTKRSGFPYCEKNRFTGNLNFFQRLIKRRSVAVRTPSVENISVIRKRIFRKSQRLTDNDCVRKSISFCCTVRIKSNSYLLLDAGSKEKSHKKEQERKFFHLFDSPEIQYNKLIMTNKKNVKLSSKNTMVK